MLVLYATLATLATLVAAQCGSGTPTTTVTGSGSSFVARKGSTQIYSGSDYRLAIQTAIDQAGNGGRVAVTASGSIGASTLTLPSGVIFEGCGTINTALRSGRGAIESTGTSNVRIPYLTMTGNPYFGLRFSGTSGLQLGTLNLNLSGGIGIRFDRDAARNSNTSMTTINCNFSGTTSHCVEVWNIDGLTIGSVIARNVGESGLLIQASTNVRVSLVDGNNVATGTGYATLRFANRNGRSSSGTYPTNVIINKVVSRGGGRGIFCVSESGGVQIDSIDLASNGSNAILLENCYNVNIRGGTVNGGGEVRVAARTEFPNSKDITITATINNTSVKESPCGENITWNISGNASKSIC